MFKCLNDFRYFKTLKNLIWFVHVEDRNLNMIINDEGTFLVNTEDSYWEDWEDQLQVILDKELWVRVVPVSSQLGAEICTDVDGNEYFVTAAPESYTWLPENRGKVMEWLNSLTRAGEAPEFPEYVFKYEEEEE